MTWSSPTDEAAARRLVLGLSGPALHADEAVFLSRHPLAGVILFSRNLTGGVEALADLVAELHARAVRPLTLWIDQEGGRVQRLREPLTRFPSAAAYATLGPAGAELARMAGQVCGEELAALGIGVNCAPVLDIREEGADPVIGERAFGTTPEQVIPLAGAWLAGLHAAGVLAVGKHFPGHGAARADSHKSLPVVDKSAAALRHWELRPFAALLEQLPALMTAHLVASGVDPLQPATWSLPWLQDLLRREWGYTGLVVSDAIEMGALQGPLSRRAENTAAAGCDLVLCCTGRLEDGMACVEGVERAVRRLRQEHAESLSRLRRLLLPRQCPPAGTLAALLRDPRYLERRQRIESLAAQHQQAADPTEAAPSPPVGSPQSPLQRQPS
ncbi:MAG: beta-N-acetylhexosaminidase [Magnetococcus sp. WYHC-3]